MAEIINVAVLIYSGVELIDMNGPIDVFVKANRYNHDRYQVFTVAESAGEIESEGSTVRITPDYTFSNCPKPDIIVIPGQIMPINSIGAFGTGSDGLIAWLIEQAEQTEITIMSVCVGAYILAKTGLLTGRKATTHWAVIREIQQQYPDVTFMKNERFVAEGDIITTGGVTSGIDGALYLYHLDNRSAIFPYFVRMSLTVKVTETAAALKTLHKRCPILHRPKVKMLLLLLADDWLSNKVLAAKTGVSLRTIARWIKAYTTAGIENLLSDNRGGDRRSGFDSAAKQKIAARLSDPVNAFTSYDQAREWLNTEFGTDKSYHAVNKYLKRNLGTKLKVGRKSHVKKDAAAVADFKKKLTAELDRIKVEKFESSGCTTTNIYAMDESRFGLLSIQRRCLTARGVKPLVPYQHQFKNFYLFGGYSPVNGDHYTLEFPYCNTECFQHYLDGLSGHKPEEFKILILDNGAFHKGRRLEIPKNIGLLFLPPYSPELNPAEKMWRYIKDRLANVVFKTLSDLSDEVVKIIQQIDNQIVQSITGWVLYRNCVS